MTVIKNIVFDFGNVLVRWNPRITVAQYYQEPEVDLLTNQLFQSQTWLDYNQGLITLAETIDHYHHQTQLTKSDIANLIESVKHSLIPLKNSFELRDALAAQGYNLFGLSDISHEYLNHLKTTYAFHEKFLGIVASCEVGHLKPSPEIYQHLLDSYHLNPHETLFFDDLLKNIEGARAKGMHGIQFSDAKQCIRNLPQYDIHIDI